MSVSEQITRLSGEINSQSDLIGQISSALYGKSVAGCNVEVCTVQFSLVGGGGDKKVVYVTIDENNNIVTKSITQTNSMTLVASLICVVGTFIWTNYSVDGSLDSVLKGVSCMQEDSDGHIFKIDLAAGESGEIYIPRAFGGGSN